MAARQPAAAILLPITLLTVVLLSSIVSSSASPSAQAPSFQRSFTVAGNRYLATPVGLVLADCVHHVPSGSRIAEDATFGDGLHVLDSAGAYVRTIPKCQRTNTSIPMIIRSTDNGFYDGWLAYTAFNHSAGISRFDGNFSVPDEPESLPSVLYLFTGLQNIDWIPLVDPEPKTPFDIIQPVLQYPSDTKLSWAVKSWYVTLDEGALYSDEILCRPGDVIFGTMHSTGPSQWTIGGTIIHPAASDDDVDESVRLHSNRASTARLHAPPANTTTLTVTRDRLRAQPWAYNTLECYGCTGCGEMPQRPSVFSGLSMLDAAGAPLVPQWVDTPKPPKRHRCQEHVTDIAPDSVTIAFHN